MWSGISVTPSVIWPTLWVKLRERLTSAYHHFTDLIHRHTIAIWDAIDVDLSA